MIIMQIVKLGSSVFISVIVVVGLAAVVHFMCIFTILCTLFLLISYIFLSFPSLQARLAASRLSFLIPFLICLNNVING